MAEKILRKFFLKPSGGMYAYCSHCGKMIKQDSYNLKKHGQACDFSSNDIFEVLKEDSYGYTLEKENQDTLLFAVYAPYMNLRPGFKDRYINGSWKLIYHAHFRWNSRAIDESGMYNMSAWLHLISQKKIRYLGECSAEQVIGSVFPVVPFIYDLNMFFHIYENKGYKIVPYEPSENVKVNNCYPYRKELLHERAQNLSEKTYVFGNLLNVKDKTVLAVRLYHYTDKLGELDFHSFVVGEGILWMSDTTFARSEFCRSIWERNVECLIPEEVLKAFDQMCPSFGLGNYLKGNGNNVLIPLLASGNFHKGVELLAKSGTSWFADHFFDGKDYHKPCLFIKEPFPWSYQTVPTLLELPKVLLKQERLELFEKQDVRKRMNHVFQKNRSMIEGITLNENVIRFIMGQDITHDHSVIRNHISGLSEVSDQEMRRILKYLSKLSEYNYETYRDYLQLMYTTRISDFGYCPENLQEAHDDLARLLWTKKEIENEEKFRLAVKEYQELETLNESEENDEEKLNHERFFIRCPRSVNDLNQEGRSQHNCVAGYKGWIIAGTTKVLFMREKSEPEKSLITIEVQKQKLIQAKASHNRVADAECQRFICQWCDFYGISYNTCRDITVKVS